MLVLVSGTRKLLLLAIGVFKLIWLPTWFPTIKRLLVSFGIRFGASEDVYGIVECSIL